MLEPFKIRFRFPDGRSGMREVKAGDVLFSEDAEALELHKVTPHLKASFERRKDEGWMTEITRWERVPEERGGRRWLASARPDRAPVSTSAIGRGPSLIL